MAETLVLTSNSGTAYDLTGLTDFTALRGMMGHMQPGVNFLEDYSPDIDGSFYAVASLNPRDLSIPILYEAATRQGLIDLRRQLAAKFNPKVGAGYLVYTDLNGDSRKLTEVYVLGGLQGNTTGGAAGVGWEKTVIRLRALDPLFYETTVTEVTFAKTTASGTFLDDPFLPIKLTDSALYGGKTVNNPGDVIAYPVWTIKGALTSLSLINQTTGEEISIAYNLGSGEVITLDCRNRRSQTPDGKKVLLGSTNLFQYLTNYEFWGLQPGNNSVRIEADNTDGVTAFKLEFYTPYIAM